jgi:hypothetical protein
LWKGSGRRRVKVTLPFDIEVEFVDRVVELEMDDGSKKRYAIQLEDGSIHGQKWLTCECCGKEHTREYPTFKTKKAADKALAALKENK